MSKLLSALQNFQTGTGNVSLKGTAGAARGYRAAQVGLDPSYQKSNLLDTVGQLARSGADAYQTYDAAMKSKADERSNEIIRKLTPEQRREAIQNGTLLYQDDPYAMAALREKTGRNAAYLVDDDVATKIKEGFFKDRQAMEQYRHDQLTKQSKDMADGFGIDENDADYQRGFNSDITQRNIHLYGTHDSFLSEQAKKGNVLNSRVEIQGVLSDPAILNSPEGPDFLVNYMNKGIETNSIPGDDQVMQIVGNTIKDVSQRPGGAQFLMGLADKKIKVHGVETTYKDLYGEEQWNSAMVDAQAAQYKNDAKLTEKLTLDLQSAIMHPDPQVGWEKLQGIEAEFNKANPGEQLTAQRQQIIQAKEQLRAAAHQAAAKKSAELDKLMKSDNKQLVIDAQFEKRLNGDYISTDYKDMPTNENTGEFTASDMTNYAYGKFNKIDSMDLPDDVKTQRKMAYIKADSKSGPFRSMMGVMLSDAESEWQGAIGQGVMPDQTPALDNVRRLYHSNPQMFAQMYPDKMELLTTLDMMDRMGIAPQKIIESELARKNTTKEQQIEQTKNFTAMLNDSKAPEIAYMPGPLSEAARRVFDAWTYTTGNSNTAAQQVQKFLQEQTTTFTNDAADGHTIGVVSKASLQVGDSVDSYKDGQAMVQKAIDAYLAEHPYVTNKMMTVQEQNGSIVVSDTTGQKRFVMNPQVMRKEYQATQQKLAAEARAKREAEEAAAIAKANKRAPISQVSKARAAAAERVRENRKKVPKYIYGREND